MQSLVTAIGSAAPRRVLDVDARTDDTGSIAITPAQAGLWAWLATVAMLFAGFTSALLIRRSGSDWQPIPAPPILWLNTTVLLASSLTLEIARLEMRRLRTSAVERWLLLTVALGIAFLAGQLVAWRQLAARGFYLPTGAHSSFAYLLTGVHGAHLAGGVLALLYAVGHVWRKRSTAGGRATVNLCATYWHFVDAVWLYLFVLLFG